MNSLLSGLFGAIVASILTILYLYFTEKIRRRREIYLQVVEYLDEIYVRLQAIFAFTNKKYEFGVESSYDVSGLSEEDIQNANRKITELSLSHGVRSKVAIEYGEGQILKELNELLDHFKQIHFNLSYATKPAWHVQEHKEIFEYFDKKADPLRYNLQDRLRNECSVMAIIKQKKRDLLNPFFVKS